MHYYQKDIRNYVVTNLTNTTELLIPCNQSLPIKRPHTHFSKIRHISMLSENNTLRVCIANELHLSLPVDQIYNYTGIHVCVINIAELTVMSHGTKERYYLKDIDSRNKEFIKIYSTT